MSTTKVAESAHRVKKAGRGKQKNLNARFLFWQARFLFLISLFHS